MKQVISILFGVCLPLAGQAQSDTTAYALPEVTVTDAHRIREVRAVAPVQSLCVKSWRTCMLCNYRML